MLFQVRRGTRGGGHQLDDGVPRAAASQLALSDAGLPHVLYVPRSDWPCNGMKQFCDAFSWYTQINSVEELASIFSKI